MKKLSILILIFSLLSVIAIPVFAASASIRRTEYEGSGVVEVDFKNPVQYKNASVTVKDSSGKKYSASIREMDDDDLTFKVSGIAAGKTYSYTISGIRSGKSGSYGRVSGSFKAPAASSGQRVSIKELDYDHDDNELEIEFNTKVQYKNLSVKVTDASGKSYSVSIREKDNDSVEARVSGLKKGAKYTVKVSGVRGDSSGSYSSASKSFTAR